MRESAMEWWVVDGGRFRNFIFQGILKYEYSPKVWITYTTYPLP
jgi:hypothetical protein